MAQASPRTGLHAGQRGTASAPARKAAVSPEPFGPRQLACTEPVAAAPEIQRLPWAAPPQVPTAPCLMQVARCDSAPYRQTFPRARISGMAMSSGSQSVSLCGAHGGKMQACPGVPKLPMPPKACSPAPPLGGSASLLPHSKSPRDQINVHVTPRGRQCSPSAHTNGVTFVDDAAVPSDRGERDVSEIATALANERVERLRDVGELRIEVLQLKESVVSLTETVDHIVARLQTHIDDVARIDKGIEDVAIFRTSLEETLVQIRRATQDDCAFRDNIQELLSSKGAQEARLRHLETAFSTLIECVYDAKDDADCDARTIHRFPSAGNRAVGPVSTAVADGRSIPNDVNHVGRGFTGTSYTSDGCTQDVDASIVSVGIGEHLLRRTETGSTIKAAEELLRPARSEWSHPKMDVPELRVAASRGCTREDLDLSDAARSASVHELPTIVELVGEEGKAEADVSTVPLDGQHSADGTSVAMHVLKSLRILRREEEL